MGKFNGVIEIQPRSVAAILWGSGVLTLPFYGSVGVQVCEQVCGLCPDTFGSPGDGRKKGGLTEGERWPGAWTFPRFMTDRRHWPRWNLVAMVTKIHKTGFIVANRPRPISIKMALAFNNIPNFTYNGSGFNTFNHLSKKIQVLGGSRHQATSLPLSKCRKFLGLPPPPPPVTTTYLWSLRRIDKEAFCQDILQSDLFGSLQSDPDEYADLFDAEVTRILDIHAPLRTGRRRSSGQHDVHVLSDEAQQAKQLRGTSMSPHRPALRQAGIQCGLQGGSRQHHEVTCRPHPITAAGSYR